MSKSPTITEIGEPGDWLPNVHAGDILHNKIMEPLALTASDLAEKLDLSVVRLSAIIDGRSPVDAETDLRLGRYFGVSEGFFLRLQNAHDILEAKRALGPAILKVEPRIQHAA